MEPITLRLPEELLKELDTEADERGFSSRSEYVRHLLQHRAGETVAGPNTDDVLKRLDDLEAKIDALEAPSDTPTAQNGSDSALSDCSTNTMNPSDPAGEIDGSRGVDHRDTPEAKDSRDELREQMKSTLDTLEVPGRPTEVEDVRREAIAWAWDWLRSEQRAKPSEIANATFHEFEDAGIDYSASSSRYDGYQLWDNCLRSALRELPGVRVGSQYWSFDEPDDSSTGSDQSNP